MIGDAMQNASTGAIGTPAASKPATSGMTPHEQNGESAPKMEARAIALTGLPSNALATNWSAPEALSAAATPTDRTIKGRIFSTASKVKIALRFACSGVSKSKAAKMAAESATGVPRNLQVLPPTARNASSKLIAG